MKKELSKEVLRKEATYWNNLRIAAQKGRSKICHK